MIWAVPGPAAVRENDLGPPNMFLWAVAVIIRSIAALGSISPRNRPADPRRDAAASQPAETLIGLKLNRIGRFAELPDTPQTLRRDRQSSASWARGLAALVTALCCGSNVPPIGRPYTILVAPLFRLRRSDEWRNEAQTCARTDRPCAADGACVQNNPTILPRLNWRRRGISCRARRQEWPPTIPAGARSSCEYPNSTCWSMQSLKPLPVAWTKKAP